MTPALAPLALAVSATRDGAQHFSLEHVVGTSLDLDVWARTPAHAERAAAAVLTEIDRLTAILSTRDPASEISRYAAGQVAHPSVDLQRMLDAYEEWGRRTGGVLSITPGGPGTALNVDALGKAYILDRAADVVMASGGVSSAIINIGGDIVVRGRSAEIGIADPHASQDNARPLTLVTVRDQAIATSGTYARGSHLVDARTGKAGAGASASVIASSAVAANALATSLCVTGCDEGVALAERTSDAEAIRIDRDRGIVRTLGFAGYERARVVRAQAASKWPTGYEVNIALTLTAGTAGAGRGGGGFDGGGGGFGGGYGRRGGRGGARRPYVAAWVEDSAGKLVRVLAFWADNPRYYGELSSFYTVIGRDERRLSTLARATRAAGSYHLVWDGLDDKDAPVAPGNYRIVIETNQEHGSYGKQSGVIACAGKPAQVSLSATANFEAITIDFGPKQAQA